MCEFRAPARCTFAEIALLEEQNVVASRGSVDRDSHARGAATDDDHVPWAAMLRDPSPHLFPVHVPWILLTDSREFHNARSDRAAYQWSNDWNERVAPIRVPLPADRKNGMSEARFRVAFRTLPSGTFVRTTGC